MNYYTLNQLETLVAPEQISQLLGSPREPTRKNIRVPERLCVLLNIDELRG